MAQTKYTHPELLAEGKRRFGEDFMQWKFKCPACGHVASAQEIKDAGGNPETQAYFCCIGRFKGAGSPNKEHNENGCNWTAGGLFGTLGRGITVVTPDGKEHHIFDFADEDCSSSTQSR